MPALKLFGRKWLAATDDIVFPCIFEVLWRIIYLVFTLITFQRYWIFFQSHVTTDIDKDIGNIDHKNDLQYCEAMDVAFIKTYLIGINSIVALNLPVLFFMISASARGAICDVQSRRHVTPLLYLKLFLIFPEIGMNIIGTIWAFTDIVHCTNSVDVFSNTVVEVTTIYYWIALSLIIFAIIIAYDPLGARKYRKSKDTNGNISDLSAHHDFMQSKVSKLWLRRFRLLFCCITKDEYGDDAFLQSAELLSNLFTGTDIVPSDMLAGSILLRVRQKKENRELRRMQMLNDMSCPRYSTDLSRVFNSQCPQWMTLRNAQHFMRFAVSSYGWPMICAFAPCRTCCVLTRKVTCCAGLRNKSNHIVDDNCCNCNEAGTRTVSRVSSDDVLYASFKNQIFEIPFCILADHKTKSIVLSIRGSCSLSDIFTDLAANPGEFNAPGFPENTHAHYGMTVCAEQIIKKLEDDNLLDKVMQMHAEYELVVAGHSLGAGLSILVGAKLRGKYPTLKVYAYATPAGLLTREAAKYSEQFAFTIIIGDDCMARLSMHSTEHLRTSILESLQSCRLPKYRVILNGFAYALLGIPSRDLEKTWYNVNEVSTSSHSSTLLDPQIIATITNQAAQLYGNTENNTRPKLFNGGKILHIARKKKGEMDKKMPTVYEMRWAQPEEFTEIKVMPRMWLDHFPQNIMKVLTKILNEKKNGSTLSVDCI